MIRSSRARPDLALGLMLALTFSTGVVDAVGYLGLDRVFIGNMTGNVVILGMAVTGASDLPVLGPVLALTGFLLGAVIAGRVLRGVPSGWSPRTTLLLVVVGTVVLAVAVTTLVVDDLRAPVFEAVVVVLGLAMGLQAATARHLAVTDVTTVVVTSTITGLAADSRLAGAARQMWPRRALAVVLIAAGAAVGALTLRIGIGVGVGLLITVVLTFVVALLGALRSPGPRAAAAAAPSAGSTPAGE